MSDQKHVCPLVEPKLHVSGSSFLRTLETAKDLGFFLRENPKIRLSHSALLSVNRKGH